MLFLLFISSISRGQGEEVKIMDSVIIGDRAPAKIDIASPDEYGESLFLRRWEFEEEKDTLHLRTLPAVRVKQLQEDDDFWYANASVEKEKPKSTPVTRRSWFQAILWIIIIGGFAAFLMWWLAGSNVGLFRRGKATIAEEPAEEEISDDIFGIHYSREIEKATQAGNYRLAIRLLFLRLLKNLSEKNIIQYKQDKTNLDYLSQLNSTRYYPGFFRITRNYEYSWYGKFEVKEEAYHVIRKDFDNFEQQLR